VLHFPLVNNMQRESNHYLYGFSLTYCLSSVPKAKKDAENIKRCYMTHFPVAARLCPDEMEDLVELCGFDNRLHRKCQTSWRSVQRCMQIQGMTAIEFNFSNLTRILARF
jgi:hypothetical protein